MWTTTTEEVKRIDMKCLKDMGYLCGWTKRRLSWTCRGEPSGNIMVEVATDGHPNGPYMELDYKIRQRGEEEWEEMKYRVAMESTPCPYGGKRWWMRCPSYKCNKRVRILYESDTYFVCRKCARLWYESQKYVNQKYRFLDRMYKAEEMEKDLKRWYYRGKPTRKYRRYLKLTGGLSQIDQAKMELEMLRLLNG